MFWNLGYKIKDFFSDHMNNIEIIWIIGTVFGVWIQLFFLIKLHAIQFFSSSQTLNDFVIIFWYFILMFALFFLIRVIFKTKLIYKYVMLFVILLLLALHFFGKINHYIDGYFVLFFSFLTFFLFFWDVISLIKDILASIKEKDFSKRFFVLKIFIVSVFVFLYGYMYMFFIRTDVDDIFLNIYKINFQTQGRSYTSLYFNDKYIFTLDTGTNKTLIFPITMVDRFSK